MIRRLTLCLVALACAAAPAAAQEIDYYADADASTGIKSLYVVDSPTADILRHGAYRITGRMMHGGSFVFRTEVGIRDRFSVGISWGILGLLGRGEVDFNDNTSVALRLLLVEEVNWPAVVIGFDNQGFGAWDSDLDRYERKSKGFYAVMTRHWYGLFESDLGTSAGLNYTTETNDEESIDAFFALEQDLGNQAAFLLDYSLGLNDMEKEEDEFGEDAPRYGQGKGWLDLGLRWNIVDRLQFKFFFRDLLGNHEDRGEVDRQITIAYESSF